MMWLLLTSMSRAQDPVELVATPVSWEMVLGYALAALTLLITGGREGLQRLRKSRGDLPTEPASPEVIQLQEELKKLRSAAAAKHAAEKQRVQDERDQQRQIVAGLIQETREVVVHMSERINNVDKMLRAISAELISRKDLRATREELTVLQQLAQLLEEQKP